MESSVDRPHDRLRYAKGHRRGNFTSSAVDSSDTSSVDTDHPNRFTDDQLTDIAIAGKGETPPCSHRGPCNMSLICHYCGKAYCISQSQYFTRHKKKCQRAITSTSDSEPGTKCVS
jgi:hypothetical protein